MRCAVGQNERNRLSFTNGKIADGCEIFASKGCRSTKRDHVGTGNGAHGSVFQPRDPRDGSTVVEPYRQLHPHPHLALFPLHQADKVGVLPAQRHEIDQRDGAFLGLKICLQD